MSQTVILLRGTLTPTLLEVNESNIPLSEEEQKRIEDSVLSKIPKYIFTHTEEPRTLILEDPLGYNILKVIYDPETVNFILIRFEGKLYTTDEIRKISFKVNQQLEQNVAFSILWTTIQEIFIKIETYDFSRPIKAKLYNLSMSDHDLELKIEEILPRINGLRDSQNTTDILEYYKLQLLLHFKKKKLGEFDPSSFQPIFNKLKEFLLDPYHTDLNKYDIAGILFNFAIMLKDFKFYEQSSEIFLFAAKKFKDLQIANLELFSVFNIALNQKQTKQLDAALKILLQNEERVYKSEAVSNGFKGIYFRHLGELYQLKKDYSSAKMHYSKSLSYFEKDRQINLDTALNYLALGTINYNEGEYFDASKFFSYAANIFGFLNQDTSEITKNLGISFLNLASEYLRTVKVLLIEKDYESVLDLALKGLNYYFLANLNLGNQMLENFTQLGNSYMKTLNKIISVKSQEEQDITKRLQYILQEHTDQLTQKLSSHLIKMSSKRSYEKLKEFQPLKIYYFMAINKDNGVVIFSKTSASLHEMPELDENLIAGMISAISGFLEEVLRGDENLSLIDRDNIKIQLEHSDHLIGLLFVNKENPQIRTELKNILLKTEMAHKTDFTNWTGEISKFADVNDFMIKLLK
ncbi:MAG: hypothetical protein EU536_01460 [Promethearchaeota archaeon]|nr:MAG: hypothetical protein EU536_01460 [Candidatus Lokiarchaeota archaeon]